jgi:dTDP-3-amino-2,3,6-trideoxy-4-keto-D-glucose/dTDP-3-amino-3,4,6-trideoxy-alpha-D-glucose/dTDP-2,6-dideoxy-D-kanosamine transaminase
LLKINNMVIKVWDYLTEYAQEKKEILSAIEDVLDSGWLILGQKVKDFEEAYAKYCETAYGIGVGNGTDAIFLALKALGVGIGDEVITVANTAIPTVSAIVSTGATPVFVDILDDTYLMDTSKIESVISKKTKCILPVHLFGQSVDMDEVNNVAKKNNLYVLEDCAQSHGTLYKGKKVGSLSNISTTSFYPTKILGTFGDGGMVNTNSEDLFFKMRRLRYYGAEKTYYAIEHGYNSRLDEIHASILLQKMKHLEDYIKRRRKLAQQYNLKLQGCGLTLPFEANYGQHSYFIYVVRHEKRDFIVDELKKNDIIVNISYPWPIHTMSGYKYLGYKEGDLPITEKIANEIFSLPMYPSLTDEQQDTVIDVLRNILRSLNK